MQSVLWGYLHRWWQLNLKYNCILGSAHFSDFFPFWGHTWSTHFRIVSFCFGLLNGSVLCASTGLLNWFGNTCFRPHVRPISSLIPDWLSDIHGILHFSAPLEPVKVWTLLLLPLKVRIFTQRTVAVLKHFCKILCYLKFSAILKENAFFIIQISLIFQSISSEAANDHEKMDIFSQKNSLFWSIPAKSLTMVPIWNFPCS